MISTAINASWEFRRAASELWQKGTLATDARDRHSDHLENLVQVFAF